MWTASREICREKGARPRQSSKMTLKRNIPAVLLVCLIPSVAQANAGTSLMWAGMLHLVFGNLIIGLFEGAVLAKVFGLPKAKCIGLLIFANYLSAWLGGFVIANGVGRALSVGLETAWAFLWGMVAFTYLFTLVLEFPFVALAFRGDPHWMRKSISGSFLIQTLSYGILFGWYWLASGTSLYTQTKVVDISSISLPEKVLVYFISVDDGDVYGGSLKQREWRKIFDLNSADPNDRLLVKPSHRETDFWDLVARLESGYRRKPSFVTVCERVASVAAPSWRSMNTDPPQYEGTWLNFGDVPKLGAAESSSWKFRSGFWPIEGLRGIETNSGKQVSFSLETPFLAWSVRNATHLPGDIVLLQLGGNQICVYDPEKNEIALLANGRGPVAVMEKTIRKKRSTAMTNSAP